MSQDKLIEVKGLEKHFKHVEVLKGIDIDIHKGDVVAVIGPSGSGKSNFLRCLNLLEEPTGGHIIFEGVDITSKETNIDQMRQKIGMVFQQFNLFANMTVLDNVTAGPLRVKGMRKAEAEELAQSLLARVGLADRGAAYPIQLSGGCLLYTSFPGKRPFFMKGEENFLICSLSEKNSLKILLKRA